MQGDPGDLFYIIKEGEAVVYQATPQGTRKVNHLFKADFFGERALLCDEPRYCPVTLLCYIRPHTRPHFLFPMLACLGQVAMQACDWLRGLTSVRLCLCTAQQYAKLNTNYHACSEIASLVPKITQTRVHWSLCSMFISSDLCLTTDVLQVEGGSQPAVTLAAGLPAWRLRPG